MQTILSILLFESGLHGPGAHLKFLYPGGRSYPRRPSILSVQARRIMIQLIDRDMCCGRRRLKSTQRVHQLSVDKLIDYPTMQYMKNINRD